ncbi:CsbD family protein [Streptomyces sp. NPDC006460]|uniref:CsbD family protein n=1 Tax=Streptomyces sp. NPDC006460 TaxID=3154304 RepID=UPI0033B5C127
MSESKDKAKGKAQEVKGRAKEQIGETVGDHRMQAEGRAEQVAGKAKVTAAEAMRRMKKHGDDM